MPSRKLLFLINGLGLGNSTRCDAVIEELRAFDYEIDLLTSRNSFRYFSGDARVRHLFQLECLDYQGDSKGIRMLSTLRTLPKLGHAYLSNVGYVRALLSREKYDAVVTDSDYTMALARFRFSLPVFAINNSNQLVTDLSAMRRTPASGRAQLAVECLDFLYHRLVPDLVFSPSLQPKSSRRGNRHEVGLVVRRMKKRSQTRERKTRILVYSGASHLASPFEKVNSLRDWRGVRVDVVGREGHTGGALEFHGFTRSLELLRKADLVVINGGFSSISEAVAFGKPCVVVPLPNHAEQFWNADQIERLGLGLKATEENWVETLVSLRKSRRAFESAHRSFETSGHGAREVAGLIHAKMAEARR